MLTKLFAAFLGIVFLMIIPLIIRIKYAEYQVKKLRKESAQVKADHDKVQEALAVLRLRRNPTRREIRDAHRKLMQQNHPDKGGSKFAATKINVARDVLMKEVA